MLPLQFLIIIITLCNTISGDSININGNYLTSLTDFNVELYADSTYLNQPRVMDHIVYNNNLIIYVGNKLSTTPIYALVDTNLDFINDYTINVFNPSDGSELNGVAIDPITNYVYFMTQENVYICYNLHEYTISLINSGSIIQNCTLFMSFPLNTVEQTHARHYSEFSPNGNDLCVAFGADCDLCDNPIPPRTTIKCYNMSKIRTDYNYNNLPISYNDTTHSRTIAYGVRNSVGFDWHPTTNNFYFTDNGANDIDHLYQYNPKSDIWVTFAPDDELNIIFTEGKHYGYPYVHSNGTGDPYLRDLQSVNPIYDSLYYINGTYELSLQPLGPHAAALGMKFYNRDELINNACLKNKTYSLFPEEYNNAIFIAQHGSWDNYGTVLGYRICSITLNDYGDNVQINSFNNFITGWRLNGDNSTALSSWAWGRPAFVEILYDGSMLISDDHKNYIYRVTYIGSDATTYNCQTTSSATTSPSTATATPSSATASPSDATASPSTATASPSSATASPSDATSNPTFDPASNATSNPTLSVFSLTTSPTSAPASDPASYPGSALTPSPTSDMTPSSTTNSTKEGDNVENTDNGYKFNVFMFITAMLISHLFVQG